MRLTEARVPALDGLRAVAVLMVVACHFDTGQLTMAGIMGVTVFFTLSGYLITTLMLEERDRSGRIGRLAFYRRRARRLLPALGTMLVVVCVLTAAGFPTGVRLPMVAAVVGYVSNWFLAASAAGGTPDWSALGHTWSLAIEEQFYILWPFIVPVVLRWRGRRGVLAVSVAGAIASVSWAVLSGRSPIHTDVSAYGLLVGCALAAWGPRLRLPGWVPAVALLPLVGFLVAGESSHLVAYVCVPLLTAVAIAAVTQGAGQWLSVSPLVWIGRRSYGLYLWHFPVAYVIAYVHAPWIVVAPTGIALSFGLAALSWRFVEAPVLGLSAYDAVRSRGRVDAVAGAESEVVVARP